MKVWLKTDDLQFVGAGLPTFLQCNGHIFILIKMLIKFNKRDHEFRIIDTLLGVLHLLHRKKKAKKKKEKGGGGGVVAMSKVYHLHLCCFSSLLSEEPLSQL